jgi:glycosyltransferase involved in cell wall biosynthesis
MVERGHRMRICFFVMNDMLSDPRVSRHAETLGRAGHQVTVVCSWSKRIRGDERRTFYSVKRCIMPYNEFTLKLSRGMRPKENDVSPIFTGKMNLTTKGITAHLLIMAKKTMQRYIVLFVFYPAYVTAAMWRAGRSVNPQIYISNDLDTLAAGVVSAGVSRVLIHDAHELWPDQWIGMGNMSSVGIAWLRIIEHIMIKHASVVMTVNEYIASILCRRYGLSKVRVVMNIPEKTPIGVPYGQTRYRAKLALYQGAYAPQRGLENIIKSCRFLRKDVVLVLRGFGSDAYEQELHKIALPFRNCVFEKQVKMSELVTAASTADIGIVAYLPINWNNYLAAPNKLFEYIQAGLPIVGSDIPFVKDIIRKNEIGYVFDPYDPRSIADAINTAVSDGNLERLRMNVQCIQRRFSWDEEEKKLLAIVDEIR